MRRTLSWLVGGSPERRCAFALARADVGVTVLEASTEFADRVRGESMQPWGVNEARELGVEEVLLDAGAHITSVWRQYMEGADAVGDIPMAMMVPDIPGIAEPSSSGRVPGAARRRGRRGCRRLCAVCAMWCSRTGARRR